MITKIHLTLLLFLLSTNFIIAQNPQWENLFNGKDLTGWKVVNGTATYKVIDNSIVGISKLGTPNTFLATEKNYSNFILEFEFMVDENLNSGVQFRSESKPSYNNGRVHGYQFEIDPSARAWSGGIYDESRRGWLFSLVANPQAQNAFKHKTWNKGRIEAIGNSIKTFVNDIPCANIWDDRTASGFIALQVHQIETAQQEGRTIRWKNLRICTKNLDKIRTKDTAKSIEKNTISNTISPKEKADGWKLLWNGTNTDGWRSAKATNFPAKGWSIESGILKVLRQNGEEATNGGDIITTNQYKNFILKVDFKITEGANSGVKYFVDPNLNKGTGSAIGCEYQILDDEKHPDAKLGVAGNRKLGGLYDLIPAPESKPFRKNDFNTAMIIVQDNQVSHWLNGIKLLGYQRNTPDFNALVATSKYKDWINFGNAAQGHILLQDHGDEVWFQNVKIKVLP